MPDDDPDDGTQTVDLQGLVGGILDDRGFTAERSSRLDLLDGLEERLLGAFKTSGGTGNPAAPQNTATFDEPGFIAKIEGLIDSKLTGVASSGSGGKEVKGGGWLSKWLGL